MSTAYAVCTSCGCSAFVSFKEITAVGSNVTFKGGKRCAQCDTPISVEEVQKQAQELKACL